MPKIHTYSVDVLWTGNLGQGTSGYRAYTRDHEISVAGKPTLLGSSDPAFRGDASRYNPEDLLVASLSACHMLWFLHLCCDAGIVVTEYHDPAIGTMEQTPDGGGRFTGVTLRPQAVLADPGRCSELGALHEKAHHLCFVANSVNFPVNVEPGCR